MKPSSKLTVKPGTLLVLPPQELSLQEFTAKELPRINLTRKCMETGVSTLSTGLQVPLTKYGYNVCQTILDMSKDSKVKIYLE